MPRREAGSCLNKLNMSGGLLVREARLSNMPSEILWGGLTSPPAGGASTVEPCVIYIIANDSRDSN